MLYDLIGHIKIWSKLIIICIIICKPPIDMLSKLWKDPDGLFTCLLKRQVRPMLNKLSYPRDDWKLFCKLTGTHLLTASGFCDDRKSASIRSSLDCF